MFIKGCARTFRKRRANAVACMIVAFSGCSPGAQPHTGGGTNSKGATETRSRDDRIGNVAVAPGHVRGDENGATWEADMPIEDRLESALALGSIPALRRLLKSDESIDIVLRDGWRPHELAALYGQSEMVRLLYSERRGLFDDAPVFVSEFLDADSATPAPDRIAQVAVGSRDRARLTPLHWAALLGKPAYATALLARGAAVDARDAWNQTPLFLTMDSRSRPLGPDSTAQEREMIKPLLLEGIFISDADTPDQYNRVARVLLNRGADVNAVAIRKDRPIFRAVTAGHRVIFDLLMSHHPKLDVADDFGNSALHRAVLVGNYWQKYFVERLVEAGADPSVKNETGDSALDLALKDQNDDVIAILRSAAANCQR